MYTFLPYSEVVKYIPEMERLQVSEVARSPGQFLENYKRFGTHLPPYWRMKRHNFIKRHMATYKPDQYRHKLSLIAWAYMPPD